jgi:beta-lactam-binding protein with PASTA domain
MNGRGCFDRLLFSAIVLVAFGFSSYFWFKYFVRGRSVATPNLIGKSLSDARAISSDVGLLLQLEGDRDRHADGIPKEAVVWQNRAPGSLVKRGTRLIVGRSLGPLVLTVPDLSGQSPRTALLRFAQRNLRLGNLAYIDISGRPGIVAEEPSRGTVVPGNTPVSLLVAFAPPPAPYVMPDLINRDIGQVRPTLESRGLAVSSVKFESYPGIPEGTIIRQYPLPGHPVSGKDAISLVVSKNEELHVVTPPS